MDSGILTAGSAVQDKTLSKHLESLGTWKDWNFV